MISHKERLKKALKHQVSDRVPIDFGSTPVTGIHIDAYKKLIDFMGKDFNDENVFFTSKMQQSVMPSEKILKRFNVDMRGIYLTKPYKSLDKDYEDGSWQDMWGVVRKIPSNGHYYEIVRSPFQNIKLDIKDIKNFKWPDYQDGGFYSGILERSEELKKNNFGTIFIIGGSIVHISQFMRGFENWFTDVILSPTLIQEIMYHITEFYIGLMKKAFKILGNITDSIDVVFFSDDLGTQESTQISPDLYRKLIKPFHRKLYGFVKKEIGADVFLHSCGAIYPLINDFIDAGVTVLNPVQVTARDMDINKLKSEFGDKLVFWGGIDSTNLLKSSKKEINNSVKKTIEVLSDNGGYIACASHNIQSDVLSENIINLYEVIMN